jgi:hypothetical protein
LILQRVATAYGLRETVWTGASSARPLDEHSAVVERYRVPVW